MYEQIMFEGTRTVLLCQNRVYFGNKTDYVVVFGMWTVYTILSILFFLTLNVYVEEEISPTLSIISYFLSIPGIVSAVRCFASDPGVIPRGDLPSPEDTEEQPHSYNYETPANNQLSVNEETPSSSHKSDNLPAGKGESYQPYQYQQSTDIQMTSVNGSATAEVEEKKRVERNLLMARYCRTCKIMRPPLASHCASCNHCVKTFDHHCVFMGNCIGERNQKWFVLFLVCTTVWATYATIFAVMNAYNVIKADDTILADIVERKFLFYPLIAATVLMFLSISMRCHPTIKQWIFLFTIIVLSVNVAYSVLENEDLRFIDNPVPCIGFVLLYTGVIMFAGPQACFNVGIACKGSTQKQDHFFATNQSLVDRKHSIGNLCDLLTRRTIPSEILS